GPGIGGAMKGPQRKGRDVRGEKRAEKRKGQTEAIKKMAPVVVHDPYHNIVEGTVYGQARFYNPPAPAAESGPSQSESRKPAGPPATPEAPAGTGAAPAQPTAATPPPANPPATTPAPAPPSAAGPPPANPPAASPPAEA